MDEMYSVQKRTVMRYLCNDTCVSYEDRSIFWFANLWPKHSISTVYTIVLHIFFRMELTIKSRHNRTVLVVFAVSDASMQCLYCVCICVCVSERCSALKLEPMQSKWSACGVNSKPHLFPSSFFSFVFIFTFSLLLSCYLPLSLSILLFLCALLGKQRNM